MLVKFTLFEYRPDAPHLLAGPAQAREVELERVSDFHAYAAEHWPAPRWRAELLPGQEPRSLRFG